MNIGNYNLEDLKGMGKDDFLHAVGLQRESSGFSGLSLFGLGLLVGAGIGIFLAPRSGRETREGLMDRVGGLKDYVSEKVGAAKESSVGSPTTSTATDSFSSADMRIS